MKKMWTLALAGLLAFGGGTAAQAQSLSPNTKWHWDKGTIVIETPERPAGQQSAIGLTVP